MNLREDILAIWQAGVDGVAVDRLIRNNVALSESAGNGAKRNPRAATLCIAGVAYPLSDIRRIVVIGGGKASGRMAETLEAILLGDRELSSRLTGWVNVPDDCVVPLQKIRLHPSRPMGINEPTEAAAFGTERIIELLKSLTPDDLCINLLAGGGSALLPAPPPEILLAEKLEITRFLSAAGANIEELNTVRKQISLLKGGQMKKLCRGCRLVSLILSDVLGDPLDVIASGPTVDNPTSADDAVQVFQKFMSAPATGPQKVAIQNVVRFLQQKSETPEKPATDDGLVRNIIIGNNAIAVDCAATEARRRGYAVVATSAVKSEELADEVGIHLAERALHLADIPTQGYFALISGGEPVVRLAPKEIRGKGGRNQQLVLAALIHLLNNDRLATSSCAAIAFASGGTDGEDGPTNVAGAVFDDELIGRLHNRMLNDPAFDPQRFLDTNDAYSFFDTLDGLMITGPTGTNVCDLRIVLTGPASYP